jgi:hypothetical protein
MKKRDLIDEYYSISSLFNDDTELLIEFMIYHKITKRERADVRRKLSSLSLNKLANELDIMLDIKMSVINSFKNWKGL